MKILKISEWSPKDFIAILLLIGCFIGKLHYGLDGTLTAIMTLVVGYYFGETSSKK